ncbi:MAG: glycosyl transferase, partial [Jatrophihabitans endophyticus]|nr:glycosyl transferase [Jatrophihabitans endophyticus]
RGADARRIAYRYDWDDVAARYEALCERLLVTGVRSRRVAGRPSGRRRQNYR